MASLKTVRNAIEDTLVDGIDGLRLYEGQLNPPCVVVSLASGGIVYHQAFRNGLTNFDFRVRVFVSAAYTRTARDLLDEFFDVEGVRSVKQTLEQDVTLGGTVESCHVVSAIQEDFEVGGVTYLGGEFAVSVRTTRSQL
jgi:hypothetical protein